MFKKTKGYGKGGKKGGMRKMSKGGPMGGKKPGMSKGGPIGGKKPGMSKEAQLKVTEKEGAHPKAIDMAAQPKVIKEAENNI